MRVGVAGDVGTTGGEAEEEGFGGFVASVERVC